MRDENIITEEFWVLTPKNLSNDKLMKSIREDIGDIVRFDNREDAKEYMLYNDNCKEDDIPRKIKLTYEIVG